MPNTYVKVIEDGDSSEVQSENGEEGEEVVDDDEDEDEDDEEEENESVNNRQALNDRDDSSDAEVLPRRCKNFSGCPIPVKKFNGYDL